MPHRYKVREIAQQAGLSEATVDRVLNGRPGVRENTRAEVMQAIADLDKQRTQLRLNGRRYLIDVVMQTPERFSSAFRDALEAELPSFAPAMLRARHEYDDLAASIARQRAENGRLREEARRLREDPAMIEEIARRELGLIRPGEKVFIVKDVLPPTARK